MQHRDHRSTLHEGIVQLQRTSEPLPRHEYPILNISRGGLCFQSDESFDLNEEVRLNVLIDQHEIMHLVRARVCYCNDTGKQHLSQYGLSFLDHFIDTEVVRDSGLSHRH